MNRRWVVVALIVVGALGASAVSAGEEGDGLICRWLDGWFGDEWVLCPTPQLPDYPTRGIESVGGNDWDPKCLGCGGLPTGPGDVEALERVAENANGDDVAPICLGCGGPPAPGDTGRSQAPVE